MTPMFADLFFGTNAVRWFAIAELLMLLYCGSYLLVGTRGRLAKGLWPAGVAFGWVLLMVTLAVVVNAFSSVPPTPGLKALSVAIAPAVGAVVVVTSHVMRRKP